MRPAHTPAAPPAGLFVLLALTFGLLTGCAGLTEPTRADGPVDDRVITSRVQKAIANEVGPAAVAGIDVDTRDGVVRLSGVVASAAHRTQAAAAAASARGVRQVENGITLR
jgi:osmotically-inducible protein OsmY